MTILVVTASLCASAGAEPTKVFPMTGSRLSKPKADAPIVLTRVLARAMKAGIASFPIDDAAGLMECDLEAVPCLVSVAKSVGATQIVFGTVEGTERGAIVRLTTFDTGAGEDRERRLVLSGESSDELAEQLAYVLEHGSAKPAPETTPVPETPPPETPVAPEPKKTGIVTPGTWTMLVGGGAATLAGAGLLISANSLRADLAKAPRNTLADISHLRAIEAAGKARVQIGGALAIGGGIVATIGIVRMVVQRRTPRDHGIDVVPETGGVSVLFTTRLP